LLIVDVSIFVSVFVCDVDDVDDVDVGRDGNVDGGRVEDD
jgi:hypothetical protein